MAIPSGGAGARCVTSHVLINMDDASERDTVYDDLDISACIFELSMLRPYDLDTRITPRDTESF